MYSKKFSYSLLSFIYLFLGSFAAKAELEFQAIEIQGPLHTFTETTSNRDKIYCQVYSPTDKKSLNKVVVFLHGGPNLQNEGQYDNFITSFLKKGYQVYVPEIIGSSKYDTYGQDVNALTHNYVGDIKAVFQYIQGQNPKANLYGAGHSLGAHQLMHYVLDGYGPKLSAAAFYAGPWDVGANRFAVSISNYYGWDSSKDITEQKIESIPENDFNNLKSGFVGASYNYFGFLHCPNSIHIFTNEYNPVMNNQLNKEISTISQIKEKIKMRDQSDTEMTPMAFFHGLNDTSVIGSLTLDMLFEIQQARSFQFLYAAYIYDNAPHAYWVKNEAPSDFVEKTVVNTANFFEEPNRGYFYNDSKISPMQLILKNREYPIRSLHQKAREIINPIQLPTTVNTLVIGKPNNCQPNELCIDITSDIDLISVPFEQSNGKAYRGNAWDTSFLKKLPKNFFEHVFFENVGTTLTQVDSELPSFDVPAAYFNMMKQGGKLTFRSFRNVLDKQYLKNFVCAFQIAKIIRNHPLKVNEEGELQWSNNNFELEENMDEIHVCAGMIKKQLSIKEPFSSQDIVLNYLNIEDTNPITALGRQLFRAGFREIMITNIPETSFLHKEGIHATAVKP